MITHISSDPFGHFCVHCFSCDSATNWKPARGRPEPSLPAAQKHKEPEVPADVCPLQALHSWMQENKHSASLELRNSGMWPSLFPRLLCGIEAKPPSKADIPYWVRHFGLLSFLNLPSTSLCFIFMHIVTSGAAPGKPPEDPRAAYPLFDTLWSFLTLSTLFFFDSLKLRLPITPL